MFEVPLTKILPRRRVGNQRERRKSSCLKTTRAIGYFLKCTNFRQNFIENSTFFKKNLWYFNFDNYGTIEIMYICKKNTTNNSKECEVHSKNFEISFFSNSKAFFLQCFSSTELSILSFTVDKILYIYLFSICISIYFLWYCLAANRWKVLSIVS